MIFNKAHVSVGLKILGTLFAGGCFIYPFLSSTSSGIIGDFKLLGPQVFTITVIIFFAIVAWYCWTLERCLSLLPLNSRLRRPKSVWWMFIIPYNFTEDFFIIYDLAKSLEKTSLPTKNWLVRLDPNGMFTGIGWCSFQFLSLLPNDFGRAMSIGAIILWIPHWLIIENRLSILRRQEV